MIAVIMTSWGGVPVAKESFCRACSYHDIRRLPILAVVQNSLSGTWPTLAKKCNPLASSFAKLSRSPFSHVGQLGVSIWMPTFEKPNCICTFIWMLTKVTS